MTLKVRASAWPLAQMILDAGGSLDALTTDADGWHSAESITRGLVTQLWAGQGVQATARPWGQEHPVDWARRTGRVTARSEPSWRSDYDRDQSGIGAVLASLDPVVAVEPSAVAPPGLAVLAGGPDPAALARYQAAVAAAVAAVPQPSSRPLSEALEEAVYGPSRAKVWAMQDAAGESELAEQLQREADEAATAPADAEFNHLFAPGTGADQ